jgi:hypothetical protein
LLDSAVLHRIFLGKLEVYIIIFNLMRILIERSPNVMFGSEENIFRLKAPPLWGAFILKIHKLL